MCVRHTFRYILRRAVAIESWRPPGVGYRVEIPEVLIGGVGEAWSYVFTTVTPTCADAQVFFIYSKPACLVSS